MLLLSDGWNDPRLSYGMPGHVSDGGSRVVPRSSRAGPNPADDNSFLGHEVGAWKGSDASWRGDDLNRTLTPQPMDSRPAPVPDAQHDSFRISDLSFTAGDRILRSSQYPQDYDSSRQQSFADMRPSDDRDQYQRGGRSLNGSGVRYPAAYDTGSGLCLTFLNVLVSNFRGLFPRICGMYALMDFLPNFCRWRNEGTLPLCVSVHCV